MGSLEEIPEGDYVEAQLLADPVSQTEDEEAGVVGRILYRGSFSEKENSYVNYDTVQWILISLLLILVYGVGILMLLYVPIRRYVVRQDIRTRKLYVTANAIVYKVCSRSSLLLYMCRFVLFMQSLQQRKFDYVDVVLEDVAQGRRIGSSAIPNGVYRSIRKFSESERQVTRPVFLPCFGVSKREKHVLLHLVTDVVVEQGCLQSSYGISSIRIEGMAVHSRPTPGDDVRIQGLTNAKLFKRIVLNAASNIRKGQRAQDGLPMAGGAEEALMYETPPQEPSRGGRHSQHWAWGPGVAGLTSWQMAYSPSLPVLQNKNDVNVNGEVLLRKLEGIEASLKRLEVLIESQQQGQGQQASSSAPSTAPDAGTLRNSKSGVSYYEVSSEIRNYSEICDEKALRPPEY